MLLRYGAKICHDLTGFFPSGPKTWFQQVGHRGAFSSGERWATHSWLLPVHPANEDQASCLLAPANNEHMIHWCCVLPFLLNVPSLISDTPLNMPLFPGDLLLVRAFRSSPSVCVWSEESSRSARPRVSNPNLKMSLSWTRISINDPECVWKSSGLWWSGVLLLPLTTHVWSCPPPSGYDCSHFITFLLFVLPSLSNESSFSYYGGTMWFTVSTAAVIINRWGKRIFAELIFIISSTSWLLASLSPPTRSCCPPLSLMMGVFLFCGGCGLSEFVFVSVIPPASAPAYKSGRGPRASSHDISLFCDNSVTNPAVKVRATKIYDGIGCLAESRACAG